MELYRELFTVAVNNRKYSDTEMMGFDGVDYYFSVADNRLKTGTVWTPIKDSKMDRLKEIGYSLISLAQKTENGKVAKPKSELIERIKKLTSELK